MPNQVIDGDDDEIQLRVQGHTTQTNPLQTWEDSAATVLAQVDENGLLQIGDDDATGAALIEAHNDNDTAKPARGLHVTGKLSGTLDQIRQWVVNELILQGSGGVAAIHSALRLRLKNENTGALAGADLRGLDVEVENASGVGGSAYGIKVNLIDTGALDEVYALHTAGGLVHFDREVELPALSSSPAGNPPLEALKLYIRMIDGQPQLYLRNAAGLEYSFMPTAVDVFSEYMQSLAPVFWLPLTEQAGDIADNVMYTAAPGSELFANGDFSAWTADNPDGWTVLGESGSDPEVSQVGSGESHGGSGSGSANFYSSATANEPRIVQALPIAIGDTFRLRAYVSASNDLSKMRVDGGVNNPLYNTVLGAVPGLAEFDLIANNTNITPIRAIGVAPHDYTVDYVEMVKTGELDGLYYGPTLGGDTCLGQPAPTFDGVNDYVQLEHNRLESVFDPAAGSLALALKMTQAEWENSNFYWFALIGVDASNYVAIYKPLPNRLMFSVRVGNVPIFHAYDLVAAEYDKWLYVVGTWDQASNSTACYVKNNVDTGTYPTGTWSTSALAASFCRLAVLSATGHAPASLAHCVLSDRQLTINEAQQAINLFHAQEPNAA